jgi:trk/ktr system potassium uptake protein
MTVLGTHRFAAGRPPGHHLPFATILYVIGILLMLLGAVMLVPALVDPAGASTEWHGFVAAGCTAIFVGGALFLSNRVREFQLPVRRGYLLTTLSWVLICLVSALPYMTGSTQLSFTDAFFEAMSGLTTTGSTVIVGLDKLPEGILLWRSLTQWIGGIGIIVMAIVILPFLRIGGMQLFRTESSDRSEKLMSRTSKVAAATALAYLVLSVMCAISLDLGGMNAFDAINHAMTTLATGGFSTKDESIGFYHSAAIQWIEVVFMTAGGLPLVFFVRLVVRGPRSIREDSQVRWFVCVLGAAIAIMTLWTWLRLGMGFGDAFTLAAFNVTSVITDTGFVSTDFARWGPFATGFFMLFFFIGGCAGSTAGAIKVFRWRILFATARQHLRSMLEPSGMFVARYGGRPIGADVRDDVRNFFFAYILTFAALTLFLTFTGLDFLTSASGVAQAMANAGPGLGTIIGPAGTFAPIPDAAKWALSLAMLLGRLELFTVYVLFLPRFWRW